MNNPFRAFVATEPTVFVVQLRFVTSLEKPKDVADELRADARFSTETGNANDGSKRPSEVALLPRVKRGISDRCEHDAIRLDDEGCITARTGPRR